MPIKKSNLFGNQSGSSRIDRIKKDTANHVKSSYPNGYLVKNETEQNSRMTALTRMRSNGYIVPRIATYFEAVTIPDAPIGLIATVLSTSAMSVAFTALGKMAMHYIITSNLGDIATGTSSPIIVSGLSSNTPYTFTMTATNLIGTSKSISFDALATDVPPELVAVIVNVYVVFAVNPDTRMGEDVPVAVILPGLLVTV